MMSLADEFEMDIECPECDTEILITAKDFGQTITCPNCGSLITIQDNGVENGLNQVENDLDSFLDNLFK